MLLLRNKDQQQKNQLPILARIDTRTVNLALVQCECLTGKQTVIARITSINRN